MSPSRNATRTTPINGRAGCERAATRRARDSPRRWVTCCGLDPIRGSAAAREAVTARGLWPAGASAAARETLRRAGRAPAGSARALPKTVTGWNRPASRTSRARRLPRRPPTQSRSRTRRRPENRIQPDPRAGAHAPRAGGVRMCVGGGTGCGGSFGSLLAQAARRRAVRSRALRARGLRAISSVDGRRGWAPTGARRGEWPHTQTGTSGGQTQPRRSACMKRLTMRSSSEW